jgi:hypothetical protein
MHDNEIEQLRLVRTVKHADYSREDGVTLTLSCDHEEFIPGMPRSPIPSCFRRICKQCAN